ncbi:hypothetical protein BaRGS_00030746 [Batillaria attramentaria]|uniref:MACPF domain-containing protein n=1 Tax=Batillaria attramentaria TaxID=370345 RepID=A0ABD0JTZ8_9CAEN
MGTGQDQDEVTLNLLERVDRLEREKEQLLKVNNGRGNVTVAARQSKIWAWVAGLSLVATAVLAVNLVLAKQSATDSTTHERRRDVGEWGSNRPWNFNSDNQVDGFSPLLDPGFKRQANRGNGGRGDDDKKGGFDPEFNDWRPRPPHHGHDHDHDHVDLPHQLDIKYQGVQYDDPNPECTGLGLFKGTFPDMDYGFMGYNILKGYPLEIGHDPGFTLPIFAADYNDGFQTADCLWSIPQGYILLPDVSCITSFSSEIIESTRALSETLETKAKVKGSGWGSKFSASAGYQSASSELESGQSVYIVSSASCDYYYMKLKEYDLPPFDSLFVEWILRLNNTDDDNTYLDFFANYGTHYIQEASFGASFTYEYKMDSSTYESETSSGVDVAVSASYSGAVKSKTTSRTLTVGAPPPSDGDTLTWAAEVKQNPLPVSYDLESIENLFTELFMGPGTYMENYTIDYDAIKTKIENTKKTYCEQLKSEGLVDDCSDYISGITLDNTKLSGDYTSYSDIETSGACIDLCYDLTDCEAVDYCDVCRVYMASAVDSGSYDEDWESTILLPNVASPVILRDTGISGVERALNDGTVSNAYDCFTQCAEDSYCVAFSFCPCEGLNQKCYLYSETLSYLTTQVNTTSYFLSDDAKLTTSLLFSLSTTESLWSGPYCGDDSDCLMDNTQCYDGACLCTAGYYYSVGSDACVSCKLLSVVTLIEL